MTDDPSRNGRDGSDGPTGNGTGAGREERAGLDDGADRTADAEREEDAEFEEVPLDIAGHDGRSPPGAENGTNGDGPNGASPDGVGVGENGATPDEATPDDVEHDEAPTDGTETAADGAADADDEDEYLSAIEPVEEAPEEEVEPVELLVQLAKDDEIEPWDIDIVRVTDEFLARLDDADLRAGGRALFYASVLLRMKSDAMLQDGPPDHEAEARNGPLDDPAADGPAIDPFDQLEREMDRRLERKHARGTPQTLDELVRELRERERETYWKEHRSYDTSESPHGYARGTQELDYRMGDDLRMDDEPTEADAFGRTHDEHMEDTINEVYMALREQYDAGRDEVLFREVRDAGGTKVDTFLGLLFLAHRGQVSLQQDELFGDLWVRDPAAVTEREEALAD